MNKKLVQISCIVGCLVLVNGCSFLKFGKKTTKDSAPRDIDVSRIKEPVPQNVPYSRGGNPKSYEVFGKRYHTLPTHIGYEEVGTASWYGTKFHGRLTSNGEKYDVYGMTAAHKSLPLPTFARVTNLENGKSIVVRVNDRGPFVDDRIIDLSYAAAKKLGYHKKGTAKVKVSAIDAGKGEFLKRPKSVRRPSPVVNLSKSPAKPVYLQLGAFKQANNAQNLATSTKNAIKEPNLGVKVVADSAEKDWLYKVVVGPITNIEKAQLLKQRLHALNGAAATIISEL